MTGYTRQSVASIINGEDITAPPLNAEFNSLQSAFNGTSGHSHDGGTGSAPKINLGTSVSGYLPSLHGGVGGLNNMAASTAPTTTSDVSSGYAPGSIWLDTSTGRFYLCVVNTANNAIWTELVGVQEANRIVPHTNDAVSLGTTTFRFKDAFFAGTVNSPNITAASALTSTGTLTVSGASTLATVQGTTITATTGFIGGLTGNVTGNVTGNLTGNVTGDVTGNLTGNVTAGSGTSTFSDVTINGTLNMDGTSSATITNLTDPSNPQDASTKNYTDTQDNLKLNLAGGTMSGVIAMGSNKITGVGTPTASTDAATKDYVDTSVAGLIDSAPGALDTLNELSAALGDDPNFSTTITNQIATKLPLSGGTMSGSIAMGTNKVTGLGTPTDGADATSKTYVDSADAAKVSKSGDTMSGNLSMSSNKVTALANPTASSDAANKSYVDSQDGLKVTKSGDTMSGDLAMGSNKITGLGTPTASTDAANKTYVDGILGSSAAASTSAAAAATSESNAASSASNAASSESNALSYKNSSAASAADAANSAAAAATALDSFDDRYLGSKASAPSLDNDGNTLVEGALYFDSTSNGMQVYDGANWIAASSSGNISFLKYKYVATNNQTTFSGQDANNATLSYTVGNIVVMLNGIVLDGSDYTATSGTSVVLSSGASTGDELTIRAYQSFTTADMVPASTGGTFGGNVNVTGTVTADGLRVSSATSANSTFINGVSAGMQIILADQSWSAGINQNAGNLYLQSGGLTNRLKIDSNGDIRFYEDTGTTPKFFWDASAERLGIGTTSPRAALAVQGPVDTATISTSSTPAARINNGGAISNWIGSNGYSYGYIQSIQDDGSNNLKPLSLQPLGGNVGIGTSSPSNKLHVHGGSSGTNVDVAKFSSNTGAFSIKCSNLAASNPVWTLRTFDGEALAFADGTTENMRIDSSGRVGIGTSSPSQKLDVNGNIRVQGTYPKIEFVDTNSNPDFTLIGGNGAFQFYDETNSSERMRIDSSGNLLVGTTTSRGTRATIEGSSALVTAQGVLDVNSTNALGENLGATVSLGGVSTSAGAKSRYAVIGGRKENANDGNYAGYFQIATTNGSGTTSEAMRIDSSGNVGIGTSSPSAKLDIEGNFENNYALRFTNTKGTGKVSGFRSHGTNGENLALVHDGRRMQMWQSDGTHIFESTSGSERMRIDSSGRVTMPYQPRASLSHSGAVSQLNTVLTSSNFYNTTYCNIGNHFNASTGRFTCPVAGVYRVYMRYSSDNTNANVRLRKNGSAVNELFNQQSGISSVSSEIVVSCQANDFLDIQAYAMHALNGSQHKQVTFELLG